MVDTVFIINSFLLGLSASFAPCLFPVLPTFMAYLFQNEEGSSSKRGLLAALAVVGGVMTVFLILNLIFSTLGNQLGLFLSDNYLQFRFIQGVILAILGLLLALNVTMEGGFLSRLTTKANEVITSSSNPYIQSYLIGIFFAVLAAPCAFIVFATYFSYIVINPGVLNAVILTIAFSLGAGVPFFILGGIIPELQTTVLNNKDKVFRYLPV
ncbi:MAG: cytochrome c biogenesis CcdA family protein, partial [Candidatus Kariarchaeaceae archaeon]